MTLKTTLFISLGKEPTARHLSQDNAPSTSGEELQHCRWPREEILLKAREYLRVGGIAARRELVRTSLELDRILAPRHPHGPHSG